MNPNTIHEQYAGTTIGPLKIPYFPLVDLHKNPLDKDHLHITKVAGKYTIPDDKANAFAEDMIEKLNAKKGSFDGPTLKLVDYSLGPDGLTLDVQPSSFFKHKSTNLSLDKDVIWNMVEERNPDYSNLDDGLSNAIGTGVVAITKDNKIVIFERKHDIDQYPGLYGTPSGFVNPLDDDYNPFNTQRRILKKQMGIEEEYIKKPELIGVGRAGDDRHIELSFYAQINKTFEELQIPDKTKHENIIPLEFTPEAVAEYLAETVESVPRDAVKRGDMWIDGKTPKWVPAQADAINKALRMNNNPKRVDKAISDEFYRSLKPVA